MSDNNVSLLDTSSLGAVKGARIAIVYTDWNEKIVTELINGCERIVQQFGMQVVEKLAVPGCVEIPFACKQLYEFYHEEDNVPEAIIAFGAVIRGGTPHFEYVCKSVTEGILRLNLILPVPVIFGVLTLDNERQAWERLGGEHGHKGEEAAISALKMIKNSRRLSVNSAQQ